MASRDLRRSAAAFLSAADGKTQATFQGACRYPRSQAFPRRSKAMSTFSFPPDEVLTSYAFDEVVGAEGVIRVSAGPGTTRLVAEKGSTIDPRQFRVFQLSSKKDGPALLEASLV